LPEMQKNISMQ